MTLVDTVSDTIFAPIASDALPFLDDVDVARAAIAAVLDWQLTQSRDPVVLHSLAAMRKDALGE